MTALIVIACLAAVGWGLAWAVDKANGFKL